MEEDEIHIKWTKRTKRIYVNALGEKCQNCGYNKCIDALEFHHIDPSKKEFSFSKSMPSPLNSHKSIPELKKCMLLCAICHREYHAGIISLPEKYAVLDEIPIMIEKTLRIYYRKQVAYFSPSDEVKNNPEKWKMFVDKRDIVLTPKQIQSIMNHDFEGTLTDLASIFTVNEEKLRKHMNRVSLLNME